jgi:hypothetical protein
MQAEIGNLSWQTADQTSVMTALLSEYHVLTHRNVVPAKETSSHEILTPLGTLGASGIPR